MSWPPEPQNDPRKPRILVAFTGGAGVLVSTETPLLALTEWGVFYSDLVFTLRNLDDTNIAALYVDQSESGVVVDSDRDIVYVPPLKERRVEFRDLLALKWSAAASGDPDSAFPPVHVDLQVVGRARIR